MMDTQTRQMLIGNVLLIACCGCYLLWWILAFKPEGAIKGMRSGWLLVPAVVFGIAAILFIVIGSNGSEAKARLIPTAAILLVGLAAYVILLIATWIILKRPVTTELLLIVGWSVLTFLEVNALFALGSISRGGAVAFFVIIVVAAVIGLVCYLLYYGLEVRIGYIDGMIPLLLFAGVMVALTVALSVSAPHS